MKGSELNNLINLPPTLRNNQVEVIILPAVPVKEEYNIAEEPKQKRELGFAAGAEVPDSFFEPLSEEELQAWGL
jgi:hypothetical protein